MGTASLRTAPIGAINAEAGTKPAKSVSSPLPVAATLLGSDLLAVSLAALVSILGYYLLGAPLKLSQYIALWPLGGVFFVAYATIGLYPGTMLNSVQELRRGTVASSLVFASIGASTFLTRDAELYSRAVFLMTWGQCLVYLPLFRALTRSYFSRFEWWGSPVVVIGASESGSAVVESLQSRPELGLRPIALTDHRGTVGKLDHRVPLISFDQMLEFTQDRRVRYGIIAMPDLPRREILTVLNRCSEVFSQLLVIPELTGATCLWVDTKDLGGVLGLEIRQRLLLPVPQALKRVIDLLITVIGGSVVFPLIVLIAVGIKLTSTGPIFFGHRRYGKAGKPFTAWKFRSMVSNADEVLTQKLSSNATLRQEWERHRKLKNDPRVTPMGRFLRKTSLDELPQLWNVFRGEMSLVGPRPIVADEIAKYGEDFNFYKKAVPGITGLWQVSGRTDTGYEQRVRLDMYYVSNWSVWLDIHILARTLRTVLQARGAY